MSFFSDQVSGLCTQTHEAWHEIAHMYTWCLLPRMPLTHGSSLDLGYP